MTNLHFNIIQRLQISLYSQETQDYFISFFKLIS